jgi:SCY1-like protein 2
MITCLENIDLFQQKTSSYIFKEGILQRKNCTLLFYINFTNFKSFIDVMPLIYHALEVTTPAIQEKVLKIIPTVADSLDISTVKVSLFPRIQV